MARKANTVERRIALEYRAWLARNPNATRSRRLLAFNRIADKHLKKVAA